MLPDTNTRNPTRVKPRNLSIQRLLLLFFVLHTFCSCFPPNSSSSTPKLPHSDASRFQPDASYCLPAILSAFLVRAVSGIFAPNPSKRSSQA